MKHCICHPPNLTTSHSIMHANQIGTTSDTDARGYSRSYVSVCSNLATCRSKQDIACSLSSALEHFSTMSLGLRPGGTSTCEPAKEPLPGRACQQRLALQATSQLPLHSRKVSHQLAIALPGLGKAYACKHARPECDAAHPSKCQRQIPHRMRTRIKHYAPRLYPAGHSCLSPLLQFCSHFGSQPARRVASVLCGLHGLRRPPHMHDNIRHP